MESKEIAMETRDFSPSHNLDAGKKESAEILAALRQQALDLLPQADRAAFEEEIVRLAAPRGQHVGLTAAKQANILVRVCVLLMHSDSRPISSEVGRQLAVRK
jgi:hypothetical protein